MTSASKDEHYQFIHKGKHWQVYIEFFGKSVEITFRPHNAFNNPNLREWDFHTWFNVHHRIYVSKDLENKLSNKIELSRTEKTNILLQNRTAYSLIKSWYKYNNKKC